MKNAYLQPDFLYELTARLVLFSVLLQSIEFLQLRKLWQMGELWDSQPLVAELSGGTAWKKSGLTVLFSARFFDLILALRLLTIGLLFLSPGHVGFFILFLSQLYILWRWRGSLNGGSDIMTLLVLMGLVMPPQVGLIFIGVHTLFSYFLAGVVKFRVTSWRHGQALPHFLKSSVYSSSRIIAEKIKNPLVWIFLSWSVILFECFFPFSLFNTTLCVYFISIACLFHVANALFFGLNRFLWAWAAAWPSLLFCAGLLAART